MYTVPIHDNKLLEWTKLDEDIEDMPILFKATINL